MENNQDIINVDVLRQLPPQLSEYKIIALLQKCEKKETLLTEKNGRKYIIKISYGTYNCMLHTEAKVSLQKEKFPFFPYVIDCFDFEGSTYLLREYIEGETIQELIERKGVLSLQEALPLMLKLCDCLITLQSVNPPLIYRDLKAANVLFTSSGSCYLLDMGTVRNYNEEADMDTSFMGTSAVAAPEQYGARQTDKRTDVYGFGMLFYYILTGEFQPAKEIKKSSELLKLIENRKAAGIIKKCTAFDPDNRYSDMAAVKKSLLKLSRSADARGKSKAGFNGMAVFGWGLSVIFLVVLLSLHIPDLIAGEKDQGSIIQPNYETEKNKALSHDINSENTDSENTDSENNDSENTDSENSDSENISSEGTDSDGNDRHKGDYSSPDGQREVVFSSELLKKAVISELGFDESETVTYDDLSKIVFLCISGNRILDDFDITDNRPDECRVRGDIEDISILSEMKNLKFLVLEGQNITDISPLKELGITNLSLRDNPINDISALNNCNQLHQLDISNTMVDSLDGLLGCEGLNCLLCGNTEIKSFSPLAGMPLIILDASNVPADDYGELMTTKIEHIYLSHAPKDKLKDLSLIPNLERIDLKESEIESIEEIEFLSSVIHLSLSGNKIMSLKGIEKFRNLQYLDLSRNPFEDGEPLKYLENLSVLDICETSPKDYVFLKEMSGLTDLYMGSQTLGKLYHDVKTVNFEVHGF